MTLLLLTAMLTSCGAEAFSGTFFITPSASFKEVTGLLPTVEIDVVGVNAIELQRWKAYPLSRYWTADNQFRANAARDSIVMTTSNPGPFEIGSWTPARTTWKKAGATSLVLIANLPGAWRPRPADAKGPPPEGVYWYEGKDDPRRLIVPWTQSAYGMFTKEVYIKLDPDGMKLATPVNMSNAVPPAAS